MSRAFIMKITTSALKILIFNLTFSKIKELGTNCLETNVMKNSMSVSLIYKCGDF